MLNASVCMCVYQRQREERVQEDYKIRTLGQEKESKLETAVATQ